MQWLWDHYSDSIWQSILIIQVVPDHWFHHVCPAEVPRHAWFHVTGVRTQACRSLTLPTTCFLDFKSAPYNIIVLDKAYPYNQTYMSFYLVGHRETKIHLNCTMPTSKDYCSVEYSVNGFSFTCRHLGLLPLMSLIPSGTTVEGVIFISAPHNMRAFWKTKGKKYNMCVIKYGAQSEGNMRPGLYLEFVIVLEN